MFLNLGLKLYIENHSKKQIIQKKFLFKHLRKSSWDLSQSQDLTKEKLKVIETSIAQDTLKKIFYINNLIHIAVCLLR